MVRLNLNRNLRMLYSSRICNTKRGNTLQMGSNRCLRTMRTDNRIHTVPTRMGQIRMIRTNIHNRAICPILPNLDLNDPRQNPAYGHWDAYAIMSLVLAVLMPVPVLPALVGAISMWRTKKLHMKGYGLALAAVIINVLYTLAVIWLAMHGLSVADLYNETLQYMLGGAGSGQGDESITA